MLTSFNSVVALFRPGNGKRGEAEGQVDPGKKYLGVKEFSVAAILLQDTSCKLPISWTEKSHVSDRLMKRPINYAEKTNSRMCL